MSSLPDPAEAQSRITRNPELLSAFGVDACLSEQRLEFGVDSSQPDTSASQIDLKVLDIRAPTGTPLRT